MNTATQCEKGIIYRPTKNPYPGTYYTIPKRLTAARFVNRIDARGSAAKAKDTYWIHFLQSYPHAVLFLEHHRGIDPFSGDRYEIKRYILISGHRNMRAVQSRPGFTRS